MGYKFYLMLLVLELTSFIRAKVTVLDGKKDNINQPDLIGAEYSSPTLHEPTTLEEDQFPFYYNNNFDCTKYQYAYGMYADMDFQCQVFHVCHNNRKETFLCPQGTLFNQRLLVCDHWYSVNCRNTPSFYYVNEELGKISNKTTSDGSYFRRRLPEDYGQLSSYSLNRTTIRQDQFPSSYHRSKQLPYPHSTTEGPIDGTRIPDPAPDPSRFQSGRYYPQAPLDRISNSGQIEVRSRLGQPGSQNLGHYYRSHIHGSEYDNRQQKSETGRDGLLLENQQSRFNQSDFSSQGIQRNHDLVFTHYSQRGGGQQFNQDRRTNYTWSFDQNKQKNATQHLQYGRKPSSSWRYQQIYQGNALSWYNNQTPSIFQRLSDKITPSSIYNHRQPAISQDGRIHSQILVPGLTYNSQQPTAVPQVQTSPLERFPGSFYSHNQNRNLENRQRQSSEFDTSDSNRDGYHPVIPKYGQRLPQSGSSGPSHGLHYPFLLHGRQIYFQTGIPDSTNSHQHSSQEPPLTQNTGSRYNQPYLTSQQKPHVGISNSVHGKEPIITQGKHEQFHELTSGRPHSSVTQHRQIQSHTIISGPLYSQQPIISNNKPEHPQFGLSVEAHDQQQSTTQAEQQPQHASQTSLQRNLTNLYDQQNTAMTFQLYPSQIPERTGRNAQFQFPGQSLNRQSQDKPLLGYSIEQNVTSDYKDKEQDSHYDSGNRPTSYERDPKEFQNPSSHLPWNLRGSKPNIIQKLFNSREHSFQRSQYGRQEPTNIRKYNYSWQQPGSPYYSFQQPQYRNIHFSRNPASSDSNNSSSLAFSGPTHVDTLEQSHIAKDEN